MPTPRRQPDAFLIGMQRSGTTFLRSYFEAHPGIAWSRNAAHFMKFDGWDDKQGYLKLLSLEKPQAHLYIDVFESLAVNFLHKDMEAWSPKSLLPDAPIDPQMIPAISEIPGRIHSFFPSAKIILVVRNQVDWLASNYLHFVLRMPKRQRTFVDFLATPEGRLLLNAGFYSNTVQAYQNAFGARNLHVLLLEQLEKAEEETLAHLCKFLGVEYVPFASPLQRRNAGKSDLQRRSQTLLSRMGFRSKHKSRLAYLKPFVNVFGASSRLPLSEQERSMIASFYSVENAKLAELLKIDLAKYNYYK